MIKERLSIELIGKTRFFLGLAIGVMLTVLLYVFFAYFREILRAHTFSSGLIIPTEREFLIYNFFFAATSATIGFGLVIWFWFHGLFSSRRTRLRINYISGYAMFWSMALLYLVSKTGSFLTWIPFSLPGYEDDLNLAREFPLILFLLPLVFYLNIWMPIRLSYRSGNWFLKSLAIFILLTTVLAFNSPIDQKVLNSSQDRYMAPYNKIVDDEIEKAKSKGILFSDLAVDYVRHNKSGKVSTIAMALKERFKSKVPIPIDSVVLELMLVKKTTIRHLNTEDWTVEENRWPFALPRDIYAQFKASNDTIKNQYLLEILHEYEHIFKDDWDNMEDEGLSDKFFCRSSIQNRYFVISHQVSHFLYLLKQEGK